MQLINKSNQFNLTTRRRTAAEVLALAADPQLVHLYGFAPRSLRRQRPDQRAAGDEREDDALVIDTWLMSCRVLKRGVETLLHNYLCRWARQQGLRRIRGEYIPTAKNGIVRDHYAGLGFTQLSEDAGGKTSWEFLIDDDWVPRPTQIKEEDCFAAAD